ncbi:uncharacterized protein J3R85_012615 [Psidium guajava]|nr:uncharacterized protein J3R85_012615 [Psidium guajava]
MLPATRRRLTDPRSGCTQHPRSAMELRFWSFFFRFAAAERFRLRLTRRWTAIVRRFTMVHGKQQQHNAAQTAAAHPAASANQARPLVVIVVFATAAVDSCWP